MAKRITAQLLAFMLIFTSTVSVAASDDVDIVEGTVLTAETDSGLEDTATPGQTKNDDEPDEKETPPSSDAPLDEGNIGNFFWGGWFPQEPNVDGDYIEMPDNKAERHYSFMIKKGTSLDYIFNHILSPSINIKVTNNLEPYDECDVWLDIIWDLTGANIDQVGTYQITGEIINTYSNIFLNGTEVTADVEIVEQYKPELEYASYDLDGTLTVYFGWWHPNGNQNLTIWLTDDDGETWTTLSGTDRLTFSEGYFGCFYVSGIERDSEYGLYVEVEGEGDIGGASNVYMIKINSEGDIENMENSGGGRNGTSRPPIQLIPTPEQETSDEQSGSGMSPGDTSKPGGTTPPDSTTSSDTKTPSNSRTQSDRSISSVAGTSSKKEMSSTQIKSQAEFNPKHIAFIVRGMKAELPAPFLVSRNESASVELMRLSDTRFSVGIELGGKKISSLPQTYTCYFPYEPSKPSDEIVITDSNGNIIPASYYDEKNKRVVLTTVKTGTFTVKANAPRTFSDTKNHPANGAVSFLSSRNLVGGFPDGSFQPDANASGSELLTMLVRLNGVTVQNAKQGQKSYEPYTDWAVSQGIVSNKTNFEASLSLEAACKYLYDYAKAMGLQTINITASKESLAKANGNKEVAVLYQLGIIKPMSDGNIYPNATLTRGQCAEIIKSFIQICYR